MRDFFKKHKTTVTDGFILFGLMILFFMRWIFKERYTLFTSDVVQDFAMHHFAAVSLSRGEIPLWDPYFTWAFVAYLNSGFFYPLNLVMNFFQTFVLNNLNYGYLLMEANAFFHNFLASFFMYILVRNFKFSRIASIIAAITFGYCGYLVKEYVHLAYLQGAVWLPLFFLFIYKSIFGFNNPDALDKNQYSVNLSVFSPQIKYSIAAGIIFGISLLAGQTQPAIYYIFTSGIFCLFSCFYFWQRKVKKFLTPFISFIIFLLVGFGIFAIQLFPTKEYSKYSTREGMSYSDVVGYSADPLYLITHPFSPTIWGGMESKFWNGSDEKTLSFDDRTKWLDSMFGGLPNEMNFYLGLLAFFLLPFVFFSKDKFIRNFFLILLFCSLLLMLSRSLAVIGQLFYYIVGSAARVPVRASILFSFSLAFLSAIGLDTILNLREERAEIFKKISTVYFFILGALVFLFLPILIALMLSQAGSVKMAYFYFPIVNNFALFIFSFFIYTVLVAICVRSKELLPLIILTIYFIIELFSFHNANSYIVPSNGSPESILEKKFTPEVSYLLNDRDLFRVSGMGLTAYANNLYSLGYGTAGSFGFAYSPVLQLYSLIQDDASPLYDLMNVKYISTKEGKANDLVSSVFATSSLKDHWAFYSFDQNENTEWVVDPQTKKNGSDWIGATFRQPETVSRLEFLGRNNDLDKEAGEIEIEFSDGSIQKVSLPVKTGWKVIEIRPVQTSYVKIFFTVFDLSGGKNETFGFREINLINQAGNKIEVGSSKLQKIPNTNLYLNKSVMPRVFTTYAYEKFNRPDELFSALLSDTTGEKMRNFVYLYNQIPKFKNPEKLPAAKSSVVVKEYKNKKITIDVNMGADGFLVLSDIWYPGWEASVDGKETRVLQAYHALRAVQVPKGVHEIVFKYEPASYKTGSLITFLTIFLTCFYLFRVSFVRNK